MSQRSMLQARDRRARRRLAERAGSLVGKRIIVSTRPLLDAALAHGAAMGTTEGKRGGRHDL